MSVILFILQPLLLKIFDLRSIWKLIHYLFIECFHTRVTAAILVLQNNETAAILASQINPVGVVLFPNKIAWLLAT